MRQSRQGADKGAICRPRRLAQPSKLVYPGGSGITDGNWPIDLANTNAYRTNKIESDSRALPAGTRLACQGIARLSWIGQNEKIGSTSDGS